MTGWPQPRGRIPRVLTRRRPGAEYQERARRGGRFVPPTRADKLVNPALPVADELCHFGREDQLFGSGGAEDHDRIAIARKVLEQRTNCGDTDAPGDERHRRANTGVGCERSVGPLDCDTRAGPQSGDGRRIVTDAFHRKTDKRRSWPRRERERMRLPPHRFGQETPFEELATGDRKAIEMPAAADDRHSPRSLRADLHDLEAVTERAKQGQSEPVHENKACGRGPDHRPDQPRERVSDEGGPERDLVGERESEREVHEEVDGPPRLPPHPSANRMDRHDPDRDHHSERDRRRKHVRICPDERSDLVPHAGAGGLGEAEGEQDGVGDDQGDRPRGEPAVPGEKSVLSEHPLYHRDPAHEQDHDQREVGPRQAGQVAEERRGAPCRAELAPGLGRDRKADASPEPEPDNDRGEVDDTRARARPGPGDHGLPAGLPSWRRVGGIKRDRDHKLGKAYELECPRRPQQLVKIRQRPPDRPVASIRLEFPRRRPPPSDNPGPDS